MIVYFDSNNFSVNPVAGLLPFWFKWSPLLEVIEYERVKASPVGLPIFSKKREKGMVFEKG